MFKKIYSSEELKEIYLSEKERYKTAEFGLWDNELKQIEKNLYSDSNTKQILTDLGLIDTIRFMSFSQYVHQIYKYQQEHDITGICSDTIEISIETDNLDRLSRNLHKDKITYKYPFMSLIQRRKDSALAKKELFRIYDWWYSKYEYAEGVYMDSPNNSFHLSPSVYNSSAYSFYKLGNEDRGFRSINIDGVKEYIKLFGFWGILTYFKNDDSIKEEDYQGFNFHSLVLTVGSTTIYDPDASEPHNVENFIMVF